MDPTDRMERLDELVAIGVAISLVSKAAEIADNYGWRELVEKLDLVTEDLQPRLDELSTQFDGTDDER